MSTTSCFCEIRWMLSYSRILTSSHAHPFQAPHVTIKETREIHYAQSDQIQADKWFIFRIEKSHRSPESDNSFLAGNRAWSTWNCCSLEILNFEKESLFRTLIDVLVVSTPQSSRGGGIRLAWLIQNAVKTLILSEWEQIKVKTRLLSTWALRLVSSKKPKPLSS